MLPIIIMDELVSIIQQRRQAVKISISPQPKHKTELIEQERRRVQRQNWILRVVKTIKVPVTEQKKIIIDTTIKVMNFFRPMATALDSLQHLNFTQTIINLFVEFYNKFEEMDLTHIRTIIRPNNSYIIVDLIKSVIELSRKEFKTFLQQHFKEAITKRGENRTDLKPLVELNLKAKMEQKGSRSPMEAGRQHSQEASSCNLQKQIRSALFQKYTKSIQCLNLQCCEQRFNSLYFDLLSLNTKNSHRIQKYMDSCYGAKRHINYDATGLYTLEEIKSIKREREERAANRITDLKELGLNCSAQQLRENFKMKVELHETINSFPNFNKRETLRNWVPLVCLKNGDKLHPYFLAIQANGTHYSETQFEERYSKKLKSHMKELLIQHFEHASLYCAQDEEMQTFNRKLYLDYNHAKITELLSKDAPKVYKWQTEQDRQKGKQKMFPPINGSLNSDPATENRTSKSKSETKLSNATMVLYTQKQKNASTFKQILEKRLNYSSFVKDMEVSSRKVNSIIGAILKSKERELK